MYVALDTSNRNVARLFEARHATVISPTRLEVSTSTQFGGPSYARFECELRNVRKMSTATTTSTSTLFVAVSESGMNWGSKEGERIDGE